LLGEEEREELARRRVETFLNLLRANPDLSHADLPRNDEEPKKRPAEAILNLLSADLSHARLIGADLSYANLRGAFLSDAKLMGADLSHANLSDANLRDALLMGANLKFAWSWVSEEPLPDVPPEQLLEAVSLSNKQLAQAMSLVGATMPDGTVMTEEAWEEFKRDYGQSSLAEEVPKQ
jgi:uncharacterized protein YjbI with pentapeptide repeats